MYVDLSELAKETMLEYHLVPDFSLAVINELKTIQAPACLSATDIKDLRHLLWFSLDNDDSRDLDQLTYAERINGKGYRIYIAIADVDSLVKKNSPIDMHAEQNTTSVYTPTKIFPMLPEKLSTNFTSLNENEDRLAIIVQNEIDEKGELSHFSLYRGYVRNQAKLAYNSISAWLDGLGEPPPLLKSSENLKQQIQLQDQIASILRQNRQKRGALTLQTIESYAVFKENIIIDLKPLAKNRGRNLIEDFMISANQATALFLKNNQLPSLRRIVRSPKRWDRIIAIAKERGFVLPENPDSVTLDRFLRQQYLLDPLRFPDLSLTIIKLLGSGEYVVEFPDQDPIGHFGLAVKNYTHSSAPNRRFPDLITQRLIKGILSNASSPYTIDELEKLAKQCTEKEDLAEKVERKMRKSAACVLLASKINQEFEALVTGSSISGTWVRILSPPADGKLIQGYEHIDIGDKIRVKLVHVSIEKGFIDFIKI